MNLSKIKQLKSAAGYYLGRTSTDENGLIEPYCRLSNYGNTVKDITGFELKSIFICHDKDSDGFISMCVARMIMDKDTDKIIGYNYETEGIDWIDNPEVLHEYYNIYFIDVTPPVDWLKKYGSWFNHICIIDHHYDKLLQIADLNLESVMIFDDITDKSKSGCRLALEYFYPKTLTKKRFMDVISKISEYDTWNWIHNTSENEKIKILYCNYYVMKFFKSSYMRESDIIAELCDSFLSDNSLIKATNHTSADYFAFHDNINKEIYKSLDAIKDNEKYKFQTKDGKYNIMLIYDMYPSAAFQMAVSELQSKNQNIFKNTVFLFMSKSDLYSLPNCYSKDELMKFSVRTYPIYDIMGSEINSNQQVTAIDFIKEYGQKNDGGHKNAGGIHLKGLDYEFERHS
jgi:hypothetical protein|nr:MAG TPA: DHH family protein [Caudoviricetes sp.]